MIATLIKPSGGQILIDGAPGDSRQGHARRRLYLQRDTLFPWRTVARNIGYGLQLAGVSPAEQRERIAACVAQAGLRGFEDAYPSACRAECASELPSCERWLSSRRFC